MSTTPQPLAIATLWKRVVRIITWHRRTVAALLVFVATFGLATALTSGTSDTVDVVTMATDAPGGAPLEAHHVQSRAFPAELVPAQALTSPDLAIGRVPTGPLTAGSVITEPTLVGPGLAGALEDGEVVVPARLADAGIIGMLQVGDTIDVMASDPQTGDVAVVAHDARIAALPAPGDEGLLGGSGDASVLVLLHVSPQEATDLTRAGAGARLSVVLS